VTKLVHGEMVLADPLRGKAGSIRDGAVLVEGRTIREVGTFEDLASRYPKAERIGSTGHVVIPGLVNAHHHGQGLTTLQQGVPDDYLERWLPALMSRIKAFDVYLDTLYANLRLLRSGVTTVIHSGYVRDPRDTTAELRDSIRAYVDAGLRVAFAIPARDRNHFAYLPDEEFLGTIPPSLAAELGSVLHQFRPPPDDEFFRLLDRLSSEFRGEGHVRILGGPSGPHSCSPELLQGIRRAIDRLGTGIHMHCLETAYQREFALGSEGRSWIEHLHLLGVLGSDVSLAHGVWLTDRDMEIVAASGATICHNASSNLRLGSGILPLPRLLEQGVRVAIGIDGMGINDDDDMLQELRLVSILHRLPQGLGYVESPSSVDVLRMALAGGSAASTFGASIGALEAGRHADIVLLRSEAFSRPYVDEDAHPLDAMVARARAADVDTVLVDGEVLVRDGNLVKHDMGAVQAALVDSAQREFDPLMNRFRSTLGQLAPIITAFYERWSSAGPYESLYRPNSLR
jgi:5-methylthioadenosine/S-adenosylhomocysteine deaminase